MIATLQWGTLIICTVVLLLRVPDAIQGRNRTVFWILVLATLCSLLSVTGPYEAIDGALGGWNLAHLILRFLVFAAVLLVGLRVATGLADERGYRLIAGPAGRWALAVSAVAVAVTFFLMDTRGSSAGLLDIADNGGRECRPGAVLRRGRPHLSCFCLPRPAAGIAGHRQEPIAAAGACRGPPDLPRCPGTAFSHPRLLRHERLAPRAADRQLSGRPGLRPGPGTVLGFRARRQENLVTLAQHFARTKTRHSQNH